MALEQRRPYVIYDKVEESFLARYNQKNPLNSSWSGFEEGAFLKNLQLFDTRREAQRARKELTVAFTEEPGGADFDILQVKPFVGYELVRWPKYLQKAYLL